MRRSLGPDGRAGAARQRTGLASLAPARLCCSTLPIECDHGRTARDRSSRPSSAEDIMKLGYRFGMASAIMLAACAASLSAAAEDEYGPFKEMKTAAGTVLTDAKGMTLYTFDKDASGKSACIEQCAKNWPPAMAAATDKPAKELTIIKRPDGMLQWAYD